MNLRGCNYFISQMVTTPLPHREGQGGGSGGVSPFIVPIRPQRDDHCVWVKLKEAATGREDGGLTGFEGGGVLAAVCEPAVPAVVSILEVEFPLHGILCQYLQDAERVIQYTERVDEGREATLSHAQANVLCEA